MLKLAIIVLLGLACSSFAQKQNTTPVPILKQINRHNEDGSYSYGYEAADGSFKIETKAANGEVKGKYGYVDDSGNVREVEYGANKDGFQPSGTDINVAPAALHNSQAYPALAPGEIDDGQYREDPKIYEDPRYNSKPSKGGNKFFSNPAPARPAPRPQQNFVQEPVTQTERPQFFQSRFSAPATQAPAYQQNYYQEPQQNYYQPQQRQQQQNFFQPQQQQQPNYYQPQQQNYYKPRNNNFYDPSQYDIFQGHPASNLDLSTGSYTVTYG